jgi:hypothetical protein
MLFSVFMKQRILQYKLQGKTIPATAREGQKMLGNS